MDDLFDKLGATPSMIREWTLGAYELTAGSTDEGIKRLMRKELKERLIAI